MTSQRLLPAVQALGRTIVCNRPDLLHQGVRVYNNHGAQVSHPSIFSNNCYLFHNSEERLRFSHHLLHKGRGSYLKVVSRSLSTGVQLLCREFNDGENEHAHDILRSLPAYRSTTVDTTYINQNFTSTLSSVFQERPWNSLGTSELLDTFLHTSKESFTHDLPLEDKCYYHMCASLVERIPFMNDHQLQLVLSALTLWTSHKSSSSINYDMLWKALDQTCSQRLKKWDISTIFLVADHWYALRISKQSRFFNDLLTYLGVNLQKLTPTQLVQFMFYVNLNRDFRVISKHHLELKIKDSLKYISIEELGIVAMALFKSQTSVQHLDLLDMIMEITIKNIEHISNHSLGSILKLIAFSLPSNGHTKCYNFLDLLSPHLNKFNNLVLLQAALFGNKLLVFHNDIMQKVGSRFGNEIPVLRLKDIERFTYTLMLYKFIPPDHPYILNMIVNELRKSERIVEINHFPKCFVSCVNYLVAIGVFPHDLISAALQPSMIQLLKSYSWDYIGREMNELNWNIKIELSDYLGYSLEPQESEKLTKRFLGRIPVNSGGLNHQEKFLLDIQMKMSAMLGIENCLLPAIILPHFSNPDLVFCTNSSGEPVKLPEEFQQLPAHALKTANAFAHLGLAWNAVIIGGRNSYIRETNELRGNLEVKRRQLSKLGYKVSVISHRQYSKCSLKYKLQYLEKVLEENSSLNVEGRKEMALDLLKPSSALSHEAVASA